MNVNEPSLIRAIRGPITLITLGTLFAFNNFTQYHFNQTWPVLLIVFGLLSLVGRGSSRVDPANRPGFPPYGYPPPPPPPPPPAPGLDSGSYRSSTYTKGGFGASGKPEEPPAPAGNGESA